MYIQSVDTAFEMFEINTHSSIRKYLSWYNNETFARASLIDWDSE